MAKLGTFIVFDGPDGCGKTSAIGYAKTLIQELNVPILVTKEPGSQHIESNQKLREIIKNDTTLTCVERELLFMADAARHKRFIEEQSILNRDQVIISDRGYHSHSIYLEATHRKGLISDDDFKKINKLIETYAVRGDYTIIFNVDYSVAKSRIESRGNKDALELLGEDFLNYVHEGYVKIKKGHRIFIIDANKDFNQVMEELKPILMKVIIKHKNG